MYQQIHIVLIKSAKSSHISGINQLKANKLMITLFGNSAQKGLKIPGIHFMRQSAKIVIIRYGGE
jgi:hypothetical protein